VISIFKNVKKREWERKLWSKHEHKTTVQLSEALYSQPQSTASTENKIKSFVHTNTPSILFSSHHFHFLNAFFAFNKVANVVVVITLKN
jgi:hypothetical protein